MEIWHPCWRKGRATLVLLGITSLQGRCPRGARSFLCDLRGLKPDLESILLSKMSECPSQLLFSAYWVSSSHSLPTPSSLSFYCPFSLSPSFISFPLYCVPFFLCLYFCFFLSLCLSLFLYLSVSVSPSSPILRSGP